jgi:hypothetical protein
VTTAPAVATPVVTEAPEIAAPRPRRAFAVSCTRHRWLWVTSWHDVGFMECTVCGATGPVAAAAGGDLDATRRTIEAVFGGPAPLTGGA